MTQLYFKLKTHIEGAHAIREISNGRTNSAKSLLPLCLAIDVFQKEGDGTLQRQVVSSLNYNAKVDQTPYYGVSVLFIHGIEHIQ